MRSRRLEWRYICLFSIHERLHTQQGAGEKNKGLAPTDNKEDEKNWLARKKKLLFQRADKKIFVRL